MEGRGGRRKERKGGGLTYRSWVGLTSLVSSTCSFSIFDLTGRAGQTDGRTDGRGVTTNATS